MHGVEPSKKHYLSGTPLNHHPPIRAAYRLPIPRVDAKLAHEPERCPGKTETQEHVMALPTVGQKPAPFSLPNQDGKTVNLSDYAGKNVLVWFYPRAFGNG